MQDLETILTETFADDLVIAVRDSEDGLKGLLYDEEGTIEIQFSTPSARDIERQCVRAGFEYDTLPLPDGQEQASWVLPTASSKESLLIISRTP